MAFDVSKKKIVLIGAGNVGYHLGHRFYNLGIPVSQVFSRKISKSKRLAKSIQSEAINHFDHISRDADLYIIAVHDDAIEQVADQLSSILKNPLVCHTSGSVPSNILKGYFINYGCFYPLQSFSIEKEVDFEELPFCIYSPQKKNRIKLHAFASSICPNVYEINDHQKSVLHVAAVFVNNFTNHLFHIGKKITEQEGIDFDILKPLINETVRKISKHSPKEMQTGPAVRGDQKTMEAHLDLLKANPDWIKLYRLLSEGIEKVKQ